MKSKKCPNRSDSAAADCKSLISRFPKDRGCLIPILHALQDKYGYLSSEAMEEVADWLSIPASEVYGTATFYTLFSTHALGTNVVRLCESTPCHIEGSRSIRQAIESYLGIAEGGTTADGIFTLETVSCFGLCGVAPAIMVNEDVYGNLTPEAIPAILGRYRKGGQ